jgi:hypothetical protein
MAFIYYDPALDRQTRRRLPRRALRGIPIDDVRPLIENVQRQKLIPFLGAGASLPNHPSQRPVPDIDVPSYSELAEMFREYKIDRPDQLKFLQVAVQVAKMIGNSQREPINLAEAPSSWELANTLAQELGVEPFEPYAEALANLFIDPEHDEYQENLQDFVKIIGQVARLMGLHRSVPQLLTVASYFNLRDDMIALLANRFQGVSASRPIHRLLARIAHQFVVETRNKLGTNSLYPKDDFVIITTNYDGLIELELERAGVPTCVVTVDSEDKVSVEFTKSSQSCLQLGDLEFSALQARYQYTSRYLPKNVIVSPDGKTHSLAFVYKIHGSIAATIAGVTRDNIIISDQDYVDFIEKNVSNNLIPGFIAARLMASRFLFVGYSFSDWNIRGIYRKFFQGREAASNAGKGEPDSIDVDQTKEAARGRDIVVMKSFGKTDDLFFRSWDVVVLVTELDKLSGDLGGGN